MEGDTVDHGLSVVPNKALAVVLGPSNSVLIGLGQLAWRSSTTVVEGSKRVTTGDFSGDEEILLVQCSGTLPGRLRPDCEGVDGDLRGLLDTDTFNEHCL